MGGTRWSTFLKADWEYLVATDLLHVGLINSNPQSEIIMNTVTKSDGVLNGQHSRGWFRAQLAGQGRSLSDAFQVAEGCRTAGANIHHRSRDLFGFRLELEAEEGEGFFGLVRVRDEMLVTTGEYAYREERVEMAGGDDLIQFCFNLSGDMSLQLPDSRLIQLRHPAFLVYCHPRGVTLPHRTPPGARERVVSLNVTADNLARLLGSRAKIPALLQPMINPIGSLVMTALLLPMTTDMYDLSTALVGNHLRDELSLVLMESMATQLLCVALDSMTKHRTEDAAGFQDQCTTAIWKARDLLRRDLQVLPTIQSLARQVGVCETILKRGFKKTFGETIGSYSTRIRMEHAMTLLQQGNPSIARIAQSIGYQHQPSFATAFRRHFGVSPRGAGSVASGDVRFKSRN